MPTVVFPSTELNAAADGVVKAIENRKQETYEIIGIALLGQIKRAYIDKARGGVGEDGISWAPIKVGTILARLRRAGHLSVTKDANQKLAKSQERFRRATYTVAKSIKGNAALFKELEAAGVGFTDKKGHKGTDATRHKVGSVLKVNSKARKAEVNLSPGSYEIGRDTGLQFNSANPGFKGPDGLGNVFEQDAVSVTVGFGRSYSTHFDKKRKLIPETLPDAWQKELEDLTAERGAQIVETSLREKGVS